MTPQERDLIVGLFDRLSRLESQPRDPDAERVIAEGMSRAPHAMYALVQTVLVQDEALKTANARIEQLQRAVGQAGDHERPPGGFLDSMRDALFGRGDDRRGGSVPSVGPAWRSSSGYAPPPPPPSYGQGAYAQPAASSGPSFLGTAAAAAAGLVGGSLLLGGIRSMLGGYGHGPFAGTFDSLGGSGPVEVINNEYVTVDDSPWGGGRGDLAGQAGIDDIDRGDSQAGFLDTADADNDFDDSFDAGSDNGSDYA